MPPPKKRKLAAAVDEKATDEKVAEAPQAEMEATDTTSKIEERQERFKALRARAVSTPLASSFVVQLTS